MIYSQKPLASIPHETMMHTPLFQIPSISEKVFGLRGTFPQFDLFPKTFRFSSIKIPYFNSFPSYFGKFFFPLLLQNFPSDFVKLTCFTYFTCISFHPLLLPWCIYATHTVHVLDAPVRNCLLQTCVVLKQTCLEVHVVVRAPLVQGSVHYKQTFFCMNIANSMHQFDGQRDRERSGIAGSSAALSVHRAPMLLAT